MADLKDSPGTWQALKEAFAAESQAAWRHRYFAIIAEFEGHSAAAEALGSAAESDALHAHGTLDFLRQAGDPSTDMPLGETEDNLAAAVAAEARLAGTVYPALAAQAQAEGLADIADWFETLAKAHRRHAAVLQALLSRRA